MDKSKSVQYNLGLMVGEYIVSRYLPTLNIYIIKTNNLINVTPEEEAEHKRLDDLWDNTSRNDKEASKQNWDALKAYEHMLEAKYYPKILECNIVANINLDDNLDDVKQGIIDSLWDCDCCCYNLDPEKIKIEDAPCDFAWYGSVISFELDSKN